MRDSGRKINAEVLKKLPDSLRKEISDLKQYDDRIREGLKDSEMAQLFFRDPGQAMDKMGIHISPELKARLEQSRLPPEAAKVKTFTLRDGRKVNVNVNVRYSPREDV